MLHIHDKRFRYTTAAATDIRKTFARERKRLAAEAEAKEAAAKAKVLQLPQRVK